MPTKAKAQSLVSYTQLRLIISALLVALIAWQWGNALTITLKAELAQVLIERAWAQKLQEPEASAAPWPWADTQPVARLQWLDQHSKIGADLYVLAGAHGSALAFGPGLMDGFAHSSAKLVGGHRDTHFAFMQHVQKGDQLRWQDDHGRWHTYIVSEQRIANADTDPLWLDGNSKSLWLVTCYPFNALQANGPLRYVVRADSVPEYVANYSARI